MLNPVAGITRTIGRTRRRIAIQNRAHCAIANRMDSNLQATAINFSSNFGKMRGSKKRPPPAT